MKGLLIKDFKLMKGQRNFFFLIVAISLGIALFSDDIPFMISFLPSVLSLFTLSTISYDEFDNGNAFLFTLPISRRGYALEKYCLALILSGSAWAFTTLFAMCLTILRNSGSPTETLLIGLIVLPILLVIQAVTIPFQLKFGGEKGRVALIASLGLLFVLGTLIVKGAERIGIDLILLLDQLSTMNFGLMLVCILAAASLFLLVSARISIGIMVKKEF